MRTSVRRTTASSQTTTGTTRTTSSSQCTTSTPMTTLTSTIAWCTSCVESAHRAHCSTLDDDTAHLMAQVLSNHIVISMSPWRVLFDSISPFFLYWSFLPFSVFFLYPELFLELDNPIVMASLRYSAADESEDTLNSFTSHTGYEPNLLTFGELNDSSVPFSFMIPSKDQDVDDVTLGEMLTAAHRGQVEYCVPGGMSVSQSVVVVCNVRWIRAT